MVPPSTASPGALTSRAAPSTAAPTTTTPSTAPDSAIADTTAERFRELTAELSEAEWQLLGAIAAEQALGQSACEKLCAATPKTVPGRASLCQATTSRIERWLASGLLRSGAPVRSLNVGISGAREPSFVVHPDYQQRVLRTLAASGRLPHVAERTRALLTIRSLSDLTLALQTGNLADFQRRFAKRRGPPEVGPRTRAEWLRSSICEPFDAEWLQRTFEQDALSVALLVLEESLLVPGPCYAVYAWLLARWAAQNLEQPSDRELTRVPALLCQHALLRGQSERVPELASALPERERLFYMSAAHFMSGQLPKAQALLDEALQPSSRPKRQGRETDRRALPKRTSKNHALPNLGAIAPLLALLLCARDTDDGRSAAKRLLSTAGETQRGALQALRNLLRLLREPEAEQRRIDVHQLDPNVGLWQALILAFSVQISAEDRWGRASWAKYLATKGLKLGQDGYHWLSKQTLLLGQALDQEYFEQELARTGESTELVPGPKELLLWDLISAKPDWQKALEALSRATLELSAAEHRSYRVAWVVDMASGRLSRPLLQEHHPTYGWNEGRRLSLSELWELKAELPPEDLRVLEQTRVSLGGQREFTTEAFEALIAHPRVVDGMRGRTAVEVVRGHCRIETVEQRGYIQVVVEPMGAQLGVNVVTSEARLTVYRVTKATQRVIEALPRGARIPKTHEQELLSVLGKLAESVEVQSSLLGSVQRLKADPTPCVRFSTQAGAWLVQLGVRPFGAQGRFYLAGLGRQNVSLFANGQRLRCERNFELEREKNHELKAACPTLATADEPKAPLQPDDSWVLGEEAVLSVLLELKAADLPCALEWPESRALRVSGQLTSKGFYGRLLRKKGWYLAQGSVRIDDVTELSLSELVRAPAIGHGRFIRLPNGDYVEVEARIRRTIAALSAVAESKPRSQKLLIPEAALSTLSELAAPESGLVVDPQCSDWLTRVKTLSQTLFEVPTELQATLRPYQLEGYLWLCRLSELGLGACLADDMGLGKTLQILALLLRRAGHGPALVVAPTSVCSNWVSELHKFAPTLEPIEYFGKNRADALETLHPPRGNGKVVICSYGLLQQDAALLSRVDWGTAVLDEAQFIKNPSSLRAKAAFELRAKQRVVATGTPVENHLGDLWSLFRFINPGLLGDTASFNRRYVQPVGRESSSAPIDALQKLTKPFILRRLKRDVLRDLPPVTEVELGLKLSEDEALRYALLRRQIHDKLYTPHGRRQHKLQVLAEITRLRRFCCHPQLVFPDAPNESTKVQAFLELAEELSDGGHRSLVFSQFVDFLSLVREQLEERQIRYEYLDGSTPNVQREARVRAFQNGSAPLFLISLKAGGFGLNLTAADYVIHLDPWWNPAVEAQATDRAHRIGQDRPVTVYRLVTSDTIEQSIVKLHSKKQATASSLLAAGADAGKLSAEELVALLEQA